MIVVTGRVQVAPENRERFIAVATAMCSASRTEAGCGDYRVHADLEQPDHYVFVEEWADEAALQKHFTQEHMARFMADLGGLLAGAPDVRFHTVASSRRLEPAQGLVDVS